MITFLTAYVDSVLFGLNEGVKTRAYASALQSIQNWLMVSIAVIDLQERLLISSVDVVREGGAEAE
jgi:hypothetical protein